ncbi:MAG: MlaA family lipoprotein [Pelagimonas sp.]|uniref:MlaA family lipoprotein n=1 Tax=Pelagimonas sp. TaxID=2073170 RepID=UPI003D6C462A
MGTIRASLATLALVLATACSNTVPSGEVYDPYEAQNRKMHAFNAKFDSSTVRGAGNGYTKVVPEPVQDNIANFADTVSIPQTVVNQVLQGRLGRATKNTLRFGINATLGIAGLADVASDLGLEQDESDFGETLAVWGMPEGAYMVLPFVGPSTDRDTAGMLVDMFTNPLDYVVPAPEKYLGTAAKIAEEIGDRGRYSDTYDSVIHDSADSYSQIKLIYLQNRRYELGEAPPEDDIDPHALDTEGF